MTLDPDSRLARFYLLHVEDLPTDFCTYFKYLITYLTLLPLTFPSYLLFFKQRLELTRRLMFTVLLACVTFYALFVGEIIAINLTSPVFWTDLPASIRFPVDFVIGIIGLVIIIGVIYVLRRVFLFLVIGPDPDREPGLIRTYLKARKQKYCPRITWKSK